MTSPPQPLRPPSLPWLHAEARNLREQAISRELRREQGETAVDAGLSLMELNRARSLDPAAAATDALFHYHLGRLLLHMGRLEEGPASLKESLVIDRERGGLTEEQRGRAWLSLGLALGRSGVERGDENIVQDAMRALNRAIDRGHGQEAGPLLERLKEVLASLPPGGVGLGDSSAASSRPRGTEVAGLGSVQLNEEARGLGNRDRVRPRLDVLYPAVFTPLKDGRPQEAVMAGRAFLAPLFRAHPDARIALTEADEADLAALTFLGSALRNLGREEEAAACLKAVMAQARFTSRVLPEFQFLFRLAHQELRGLADAHDWMWVNAAPVRLPLQAMLGVTAATPSIPVPSRRRLPWGVMVGIGVVVVVVAWGMGWWRGRY